MARPKRPARDARVRETPQAGYAAEAHKGVAGVVYDSDVIIEILRGRTVVLEQARGLERSGVPTFCTPIAWAEVYAGVRAGEEPLTEGSSKHVARSRSEPTLASAPECTSPAIRDRTEWRSLTRLSPPPRRRPDCGYGR